MVIVAGAALPPDALQEAGYAVRTVEPDEAARAAEGASAVVCDAPTALRLLKQESPLPPETTVVAIGG
ncbi:MAG: hypothetical protein D6796_13745, partial [Caldilineae bacterium]